MKVTVEPFISRVRGGREVRHKQYRIRVDGQHAGVKGFAPEAPVLLHIRYSPLELKEIEKQVAKLLELDSTVAKVPPEIPEHLKRDNQEEDDVIIDP